MSHPTLVLFLRQLMLNDIFSNTFSFPSKLLLSFCDAKVQNWKANIEERPRIPIKNDLY